MKKFVRRVERALDRLICRVKDAEGCVEHSMPSSDLKLFR